MSVSDDSLKAKLKAYRDKMKKDVYKANEEVQAMLNSAG
jgi:phosphoribosylcarboxyaminoimidazole (NCAIR) mutase